MIFCWVEKYANTRIRVLQCQYLKMHREKEGLHQLFLSQVWVGDFNSVVLAYLYFLDCLNNNNNNKY